MKNKSQLFRVVKVDNFGSFEPYRTLIVPDLKTAISEAILFFSDIVTETSDDIANYFDKGKNLLGIEDYPSSLKDRNGRDIYNCGDRVVGRDYYRKNPNKDLPFIYLEVLGPYPDIEIDADNNAKVSITIEEDTDEKVKIYEKEKGRITGFINDILESPLKDEFIVSPKGKKSYLTDYKSTDFLRDPEKFKYYLTGIKTQEIRDAFYYTEILSYWGPTILENLKGSEKEIFKDILNEVRFFLSFVDDKIFNR